MKKSVCILTILLMALPSQAVVYNLTRVKEVTNGGLYVFEKNKRAIIAQTNPAVKGALQTTEDYKTANLTGTENYVWKAEKKEKGYKLSSGTWSLNYPDKNKTDLELVDSANFSTRWKFRASEADSVQIWDIDSTGVLGLIYPTNQEFKAYFPATKEHPTRIAVYRLVPVTYDRAAMVDQLSTVCLPFAVDKVTGADVYQISYLEKDNAGDPYKLYYDEVEGDLEAGRPYLFVPTATMVKFQQKNTETVDEPLYFDDGFYGTFGGLNDSEAGTPGNQLEGNFVVYNNTFQKCGGNCSLSANRAYIKMNEVPTTKPAQAVSVRRLSISQTGVEYYSPTELEKVGSEKREAGNQKRLVDGRLVIVHEGKTYSVLGDRL